MKLRRVVLRLAPLPLVLLATETRCLLRVWLVCRRLPFQKTNPNPALFVAPHPDDETFGCGGLIMLKRAAGVPVRVVLLTNGEAVGWARGEAPEEVAAARRAGFIEAGRRLGLSPADLRWLHLPDGGCRT